MDLRLNELPNDVDSLKKIIFNSASKIQLLEDEIKVLKHKIFGSKSEKTKSENQLNLFNEAEMDQMNAKKKSEPEEEALEIKPHTRKKPTGRKPLSDSLPREIVEYDLNPEDKTCKHCDKELPRISSKESEEVVVVPAKVYVRKNVRHVYGKCSCEQCQNDENSKIQTAPMPERILPKTMASPEILACVITNKYCDSLPFYRQENILRRYDLDLPRATMSNWAIKLSSKLSPLIAMMSKEIKNGRFIQMDETTVQVLNEEDCDPSSKSYIWVTVGYRNNKPIILYNYHSSRSGDIPANSLAGFKGYLQTDGYAGYDRAVSENEIAHIACFAHVRRKFVDAKKSDKYLKSASVAINYIFNIYSIEKELRTKLLKKELSEEDFVTEREKRSRPILNKFHKWLVQKQTFELEGSLMWKAVNYTLNLWDKLIRYLDEYFITPDNNIVENAIRPFVVGRKNWLFFDTPLGAYSGCTFYSLIETAKANDLDPYKYLLYLFKNLPLAKAESDLCSLLPYNIKAL